jgi:hypothetical protein
MKALRYGFGALACLICLVILAHPMHSQENSSGASVSKHITPLKVGVVVTEMDGAKKLSNLPYTFYVNADDAGSRSTSQVRVGLRVPVVTGTVEAGRSSQYQYMDIGTNIDCAASSYVAGEYKLVLSVDRSYLSTPDESKKTAFIAGDGVNLSNANPIVQHFSSSYNLLIHDGQTIEATSTTDPVTGRVLQIAVSADSVKQ